MLRVNSSKLKLRRECLVEDREEIPDHKWEEESEAEVADEI
jgi:hypothetical protein